MAISTQINNTAYKRALDAAEKEKLAQIAQTQGAGAASSAYLQAMNQAQSAIANRATTPASATQSTPAVQQKDYLLFGKQDPNFKVGMTDEDKDSWNAIGQKYASGDTSWNRDTNSFREDGNWSGYYDDNGNYNGWLMAVNGTGGYAPAFGGKVGETGYTPGTVFYAPDGVAYTMGEDGSLTKSGNVTLAQYGSYVGPKAGYQDSDFWALNDAGEYQRYTNQTAPAEVLAAQGYYRDANGLVMPMSDQQRAAQALQAAPEAERTAYQAALQQAQENAKKAVETGTAPAIPQTTPQTVTPSVSSSGSASRSSTRETTPTTVTPQQTQPAQQTQPVQQTAQAAASQSAGNPYQAYLDQWSYEAAPEWTENPPETWREMQNYDYGQAPEYQGSPYDQQRDEALAAAGEKWTPSEYQQKRDAALQRAEDMRFSYDPNTDPNWQAYQKQYRREGDRAMQEAMAQAAMRTGGLANSYAVTAATQAGNYYASQLSDKLPQLYNDAYNRYLQEFQKQLGISDQYQGFDDREYSRWADQQGRNFDLADRYNQYGQQDYNKYQDTLDQYNRDRNFQYGVNRDAVSDELNNYGIRYNQYQDRLGQYNTDRNFSYGRHRDAVGDYRYADETAYDRQRDAIADQRYDQEWAQQLREYADAQGWKQAEWNQYLREYGDQLSEKERQWAYQMARDAVSDARYDQEYADSRGDTKWKQALTEQEYADERADNAWDQNYKQTAYNDTMKREALDDLYDRGYVAGIYADILGVPAGTTVEQYEAQYGRGSAFSDSEIPSGTQRTESPSTPPASGKYDENGRRKGTWTDADGYTYNGYHTDGQPKTREYDAAWNEIQALLPVSTKDAILTKIRRMVETDRITDYEAEMMLVNLGYRTTSAGTGRNTIGPNNVQMVQ